MLILNGNEADAKQCIHAVTKKRYLFFFFGINIFYVDCMYNEFSYNLHNLFFIILA